MKEGNKVKPKKGCTDIVLTTTSVLISRYVNAQPMCSDDLVKVENIRSALVKWSVEHPYRSDLSKFAKLIGTETRFVQALAELPSTSSEIRIKARQSLGNGLMAAKVFKRVAQEAIHGKAADRRLYLQLVGELSGSSKKSNKSMGSFDDVIEAEFEEIDGHHQSKAG